MEQNKPGLMAVQDCSAIWSCHSLCNQMSGSGRPMEVNGETRWPNIPELPLTQVCSIPFAGTRPSQASEVAF